MKKRQLIVFWVTIIVILNGCGTIDIFNSDDSIWEAEQLYEESEAFTSLDDINNNHLLVAGYCPEFLGFEGPPVICFGNYRYCFIFDDGYVFCANHYAFYEPKGSYDSGKDFQDVYCIGRVNCTPKSGQLKVEQTRF